MFLSIKGAAQHYVLENEIQILFFETNTQKMLVIAKDTADAYLVCRYGTKDMIVFEFPETRIGSWEQFSYSWYLRGGGPENEGLDLNYFYFINEGSKYVVYEEYSAVSGAITYGIKIIDEGTGKTIDDMAIQSSVKGTLIGLREKEGITAGDELF